ncbi:MULTISPECIES: hypothetical protein [unclassified Pseudomonas]|jgi:hypothetical protein|uniref:hypothetical protein n=1 Tax=unclassified Pseudomonas TaxID=196821 RepID=UPI001CBED969|nr:MULTISPECIES: hypothetical protein [unclassified Pseudomonas]
MPIQSSNQDSIEQLHREVAALAEEMRSPTPTALRTTVVPFSIGAALALTTFIAVALVAKLI